MKISAKGKLRDVGDSVTHDVEIADDILRSRHVFVKYDVKQVPIHCEGDILGYAYVILPSVSVSER